MVRTCGPLGDDDERRRNLCVFKALLVNDSQDLEFLLFEGLRPSSIDHFEIHRFELERCLTCYAPQQSYREVSW